MKITNQLRWTVAGLTVFAIGTTAYSDIITNRNTLDGSVVNKSGIVRGATQRLVKLETNGQPSDQLIQNLDKLVDGLINGNPELALPKATDPDYLDKDQKGRKGLASPENHHSAISSGSEGEGPADRGQRSLL